MKVKKWLKNSNFIMLPNNKSGILVKVETTNLYLREEAQMEYIVGLWANKRLELWPVCQKGPILDLPFLTP